MRQPIHKLTYPHPSVSKSHIWVQGFGKKDMSVINSLVVTTILKFNPLMVVFKFKYKVLKNYQAFGD